MSFIVPQSIRFIGRYLLMTTPTRQRDNFFLNFFRHNREVSFVFQLSNRSRIIFRIYVYRYKYYSSNYSRFYIAAPPPCCTSNKRQIITRRIATHDNRCRVFFSLLFIIICQKNKTRGGEKRKKTYNLYRSYSMKGIIIIRDESYDITQLVRGKILPCF